MKNKINKVIEESNKEFESLIYESNYIRRGSYDYRLLKSFISQRDQKILSAIEEEVGRIKKAESHQDFDMIERPYITGKTDGFNDALPCIQAIIKSAKEQIK